MNHRRIVWRVLAAIALIGIAAQPARAYDVLAPDAAVAGKSIADWTAAWWTWALQAPAAHDPIADTSGADAHVNNDGPVFFVAGSYGFGPLTRSFDVPAGRPLLVPLLNLFDTEPAILDSKYPGVTLADRQNAAGILVGDWLASVDTSSLFASIDGNAVANPSQYLEVTGLFSMGPALAGSVVEGFGIVAGDVLDPTKSGGYWLMIEGLTLGAHTLHLGGTSSPFDFDANCCNFGGDPAFLQDNTINITVVPEPSTALLIGPALIVLLGVQLARRTRAHRRS